VNCREKRGKREPMGKERPCIGPHSAVAWLEP
jgi:hypothetical protein